VGPRRGVVRDPRPVARAHLVEVVIPVRAERQRVADEGAHQRAGGAIDQGFTVDGGHVRFLQMVSSDSVCWCLRRVSRMTKGTACGPCTSSKSAASTSFRPSSVVYDSPSFLKPPIHSSRLVCSSSQV